MILSEYPTPIPLYTIPVSAIAALTVGVTSKLVAGSI